MNFFSIGYWTGSISFLIWVLFDQKYLNHWSWTRDMNHWLKSSYRRSLILNLSITIGFFGIFARLLDMVNSLNAMIVSTLFIFIYNSIIVSKNKAFQHRAPVYKKQSTNIFGFLFVLIGALSVTTIFFSFFNYGVNMLTFLLYMLPLTGLIIITFKAWRRIRR